MIMSATTSGSCSRRCLLLDISLSELSHWGLHDGLGMELLPFMGKQDPEFNIGCFLEVRHGVNDRVEVQPRIYVVVAACRKQQLYDAHVPGRFMIAAEEIVLASEGNRPDLVLHRIIQKFG